MLVAPNCMAALAGDSLGQVSGEMVNVRAGPGMTFGVLTTLKRSDYVEIEPAPAEQAPQAGWLSIKWPRNLPAWVAKEGIELQPGVTGGELIALVKAAAIVRGEGLRRAEPLCTLDAGAKVVVLGELNGWLKIKAPESLHAFISAKYVAACAQPAPQQPVEILLDSASKRLYCQAFRRGFWRYERFSTGCQGPPAPAAAVVESPAKIEPAPLPVAVSAPSPAVVEAQLAKTAKAEIVCIEEAPAPAPQQVPASAVAAAAPPEIAAPKPPIVAAPTPPPVERREPAAPTTLTALRALQADDHYGALQLTDRTFHDVVENKGVAVVDFNAHWCGPCRRMSPVVDAIAWELKSETAIAKLDVDDNAATAGRFGVHRIPCLILFRDGREIERRYGACSKDEIKNWISSR